MSNINDLLSSISDSPVSFHDLYEERIEIYGTENSLYEKGYIVEADSLIGEWVGYTIKYIMEWGTNDYTNLDDTLVIRYVPDRDYYKYEQYYQFDKILDNTLIDAEPRIETKTIELETIHFKKRLTPREFKDKIVFNFGGITMWETDWEIYNKNEQVAIEQERIREEIKRKI